LSGSQNLDNKRWSKKKVFSQLKKTITQAFRDISKVAAKKKLPFRKAAVYLAVERIADAMIKRAESRGILLIPCSNQPLF